MCFCNSSVCEQVTSQLFRSLPEASNPTGVGLSNDESLADQTWTSLGMGMVKHTGAPVAHPELEVMLLYHQRFSAGSCWSPAGVLYFCGLPSGCLRRCWLLNILVCVFGRLQMPWLCFHAYLSRPSKENSGPVFKPWLCLVTTQGCLLKSRNMKVHKAQEAGTNHVRRSEMRLVHRFTITHKNPTHHAMLPNFINVPWHNGYIRKLFL